MDKNNHLTEFYIRANHQLSFSVIKLPLNITVKTVEAKLKEKFNIANNLEVKLITNYEVMEQDKYLRDYATEDYSKEIILFGKKDFNNYNLTNPFFDLEEFNTDQIKNRLDKKKQSPIEEIRLKLHLLKRIDQNLECFGSWSDVSVVNPHGHRYILNPPLIETAVKSYEKNYSITLPTDYKEFITKLGDGGVGPGIGMFTLKHALHRFGSYGIGKFKHDHFSKPFQYQKEVYFEEEHESEEDPYKVIQGSFVIGYDGCTYNHLLVLTGPEKGHIWGADSLISLYPYRGKDASKKSLIFTEWYLNWLNANIDKLMLNEKDRSDTLSLITPETKKIMIYNISPNYLKTLKAGGFEFKNGEYNVRLNNFEEFLKELPKLEELIINDNSIQNLHGFPKNLEKLKYLNLSANPIKSLVGLPKSLPSLEKFIAYQIDVENLVGFPTHLPILTTLSITSKNLKSLKGISKELLPLLLRNFDIIRRDYSEFSEEARDLIKKLMNLLARTDVKQEIIDKSISDLYNFFN